MSAGIDLIRRYRSRGIIVDTTILLLLFVGAYQRQLVPKFKRTAQFVERDYLLLVGLLAAFERRITMPHILTEVSNLLGQLPQRDKYWVYALFERLLPQLFEIHEPASAIITIPTFHLLGMTDAGIISIARESYLVLTEDSALAGHLRGAGIDVLDYDDLRRVRM